MTSYDNSLDYQSLINGTNDSRLKATYEQQRNAKIADSNKQGTNTNKYQTTNSYQNPVVESIYYSKDGSKQNGYNINGKTYKDSSGKKRIDEGSYTKTDDQWWQLGKNGGSKVDVPDFAKTLTEYSGDYSGMYNDMVIPTYNAENAQKYQGSVNDIIEALNTYQKTDSMGMDESNARAYSQLNNQYNANLDKTLDNYNKDAVSRGMFGQLPIEALKASAISDSELAKSVAINNLADSMYTEDYNMARQTDQDFMNQQNNLLSAIGTGYNMENDIYNNELSSYNNVKSLSDSQKQEQLNTLGQYSGDYQAEINNLTNDNITSNDWMIPYLQTARQDKITNQNSVQLKAQQAALENALSVFKETGIANDWVADTLGIQQGQYTATMANNIADNAIAQMNANTSRINANKSSTKKEDSEEGYETLTQAQKLSIWQQATELATKNVPVIDAKSGAITGYEKKQPTNDEINKLYLEMIKKLREDPNAALLNQEIQYTIDTMNKIESNNQRYQDPYGNITRNIISNNLN